VYELTISNGDDAVYWGLVYAAGRYVTDDRKKATKLLVHNSADVLGNFYRQFCATWKKSFT